MDVFRVVVADDFADMRHLVQVSLERSGRFEVVGEAGDGAEAIARARLGRKRPVKVAKATKTAKVAKGERPIVKARKAGATRRRTAR